MSNADCGLLERGAETLLLLNDLSGTPGDHFLQVQLHTTQLHMRSHPGQDFLLLVWLRDEIYSSCFKAFDLVPHVPKRADENDRDIACPLILLQTPANLKAVHLRHPHIKQDQGRGLRQG